ncbi:MAG: XrtA system polysaccharide deacetylase, partial [Pseudomonadota bacterium]
MRTVRTPMSELNQSNRAAELQSSAQYILATAQPCADAGRATPPAANAFTVDVEDYFHVQAFAGKVAKSEWGSLQHRYRDNTLRLLDQLARHGVLGTFFTLGWVAEQAPDLIADIVRRGHELASHGYDHSQVFAQTPEAFREDVRLSKRLLEDAGGVQIKGYRAPTFSINADVLWAHTILAEEGFVYSSSIYPVHHDLYGLPDAPRVPFRSHPDGVLELPMPTARFGGVSIAGGGGGYFRLLPYFLSRLMLDRARRQLGEPFIFYCHPWEIDPGQPWVPGLTWRSRFRHYTGLSGMEGRIDRLLSAYEWA